MLGNGFIKVYRNLLKWEWYDDINTKTIFLHLLLTVNISDSKWHGVEVKRGSRVSSYEKLAKEVCLSRQQVRTAIRKLEETGEITTNTENKRFTVFSVKNYDKYQNNNQVTTNHQPTHNQLVTNEQPQNKKVKEEKEEKEECGAKEKTSASVRHRHGEYCHVLLTDAQLSRLINDYGEQTVGAYIRKMDEWIQLKGKSPYSDYNLAIRKWMKKDGVKKHEYTGTAAGEGFI